MDANTRAEQGLSQLMQQCTRTSIRCLFECFHFLIHMSLALMLHPIAFYSKQKKKYSICLFSKHLSLKTNEVCVFKVSLCLSFKCSSLKTVV